MLYLVTFSRQLFTTPVSVGEFLVRREAGVSADQLEVTALEAPVTIEDVLQPALRSGFMHPEGLLVDESLVDIMTAPARLTDAFEAQEGLVEQLAQLGADSVPVGDAPLQHLKDRDAREARLDHEEALSWAKTTRKDLLARDIDPTLEAHWNTHGNSKG